MTISFTLDFSLPFNSFLSFRLRGGRNNKNDWYFLQNLDPLEKGFASLSVPGKSKLFPLLITGKDLEIKYLILEKEGIKKDTHISFNIKNTLVQSFAELEKRIDILVKIPDNHPRLMPDSPTIKVLPGEFDHVSLICPSLINFQEEFKILLRFEDKYYNLVDIVPFQDIKIFLRDAQNNLNFLFQVQAEEIKEGIFIKEGLTLEHEGIYHFKVSLGNKKYCSNPLICKYPPSNKRLYWGFLHAHTNKSDGLISAEEYFKNMVKAGLDFGTSTEHDHSWETSDQDFEDIRQLVRTFNQDNEFVSFFGYEYGTWYTGYGDICIYYFDDTIPIFRSEFNKYNSVPKLIMSLRKWKEKVLMICHHSALRPGFRNWDYFDNELEKLVEIYSTWGCQEYPHSQGNPIPPRYKFFGYGPYARKRGPVLEKKGSFVQDALIRGYKLGFTAGGDDHLGKYPSGPMDIDDGLYPAGITAVWADKLTKDSLWEALNERHCYGTTGPRILIEFYLNEHFMGDIIELEENSNLLENRSIKFEILSPINIIRVEIIRNSLILQQIQINSKQVKQVINDSDTYEKVALFSSNRKEQFIFYYLRIFLENNNMAWCSPIWIVMKNS